jgi:hypothetical protein
METIYVSPVQIKRDKFCYALPFSPPNYDYKIRNKVQRIFLEI